MRASGGILRRVNLRDRRSGQEKRPKGGISQPNYQPGKVASVKLHNPIYWGLMQAANTFAAETRAKSARSELGVSRRVFAYIGDSSKGADLAQYADGAVFRGKAGFKAARACASDPYRIIDTELYLKDRDRGVIAPALRLSPAESVDAQLNAGASCLLAPSQFPRERDAQTIARQLQEGEAFIDEAQSKSPTIPAFVPVVIRYNELSDGRWIHPIGNSGLPIATVFAGHRDPLSHPGALEGAIRLIEAAEAVFALRCDFSGVGLMATNAIAGAIGTSSAVRHLWLPTSGKSNNKASRSVFVPSAANWMKEIFVKQTEMDPDTEDLFRCDCLVCGPDGDIRNLDSAYPVIQDRHSIASAYQLAREVLDSHNPLAQWQAVCERARETYNRLQHLGISGPTMPDSLIAWLRLMG